MKIKLKSFESLAGDVQKNYELTLQEIKTSIDDNVDILVLPSLFLTGEIGDLKFNSLVQEKQKEYINKINEEILKRDLVLISSYFDGGKETPVIFSNYGFETIANSLIINDLNIFISINKNELDKTTEILENSKKGINCVIDLTPELDFANENKTDYAKTISKLSKIIYLKCAGRGHNPVDKGIYSNQKLISFNGKILKQTNENVLIGDLPHEEVNFLRKKDGLLPNSYCDFANPILSVPEHFEDGPIYNPTPYYDKDNPKEFFEKILDLQSYGLYKKMKSMNREKICIGLSGGLDSTVSLLSCVHCFKRYNLPLENIIGITMPGFGTTEKSKNNALKLMKYTGITSETIDLKPLLTTHLSNIKQPENYFDITYEQTQSRERTQVLLDYANKENAIMIGTGCMSEFALGWMTYGGDHLSMYAINIGLPKTLVRKLLEYYISNKIWEPELKDVLNDILNAPVSPELLPVTEEGEQHEKTEEIIGDYLINDFIIYHFINNGYNIHQLFNAMIYNFNLKTEDAFHCLETFVKRFISRQYKKNCYGDGIQVLNYSVSPILGISFPSDVNDSIWKKELEELKDELK